MFWLQLGDWSTIFLKIFVYIIFKCVQVCVSLCTWGDCGSQRQGVHLANIDDDCGSEVKARVTDFSKEEPGGILEKQFYLMRASSWVVESFCHQKHWGDPLVSLTTLLEIGKTGETGGLNLRACRKADLRVREIALPFSIKSDFLTVASREKLCVTLILPGMGVV